MFLLVVILKEGGMVKINFFFLMIVYLILGICNFWVVIVILILLFCIFLSKIEVILNWL